MFDTGPIESGSGRGGRWGKERASGVRRGEDRGTGSRGTFRPTALVRRCRTSSCPVGSHPGDRSHTVGHPSATSGPGRDTLSTSEIWNVGYSTGRAWDSGRTL